uniref:Glycine cleavage system H protein n=1 Tax=Alexandrium catenella TaxID=2925 RepID=A0A7S1QHX5_ALECA
MISRLPRFLPALRGSLPRVVGAAPASRFPAAPMAVLSRSFSVNFAKTHEWLRVEANNEGVLGISDFAQSQLGEVVYCDLPSEGASFKAKDTICTLESVKAVGEVYAPADCEVVAVNERLGDEPALVNSSPLSDGWLVKVKYTGDLAEMMNEAAYEKYAEAESKED